MLQLRRRAVAAAAPPRRRFFGTNGAPPPTKVDRCTAADSMMSAHGSTSDKTLRSKTSRSKTFHYRRRVAPSPPIFWDRRCAAADTMTSAHGFPLDKTPGQKPPRTKTNPPVKTLCMYACTTKNGDPRCVTYFMD